MGKKLENAMSLYLEGIRDGNAREAVTKYTGDRYTQHSTGVRDGIEGFVEFFEPFIERNPSRDIQIIRSIEDGKYVFVHAYQNINNGEAEWVTTDFFDTDDQDQIVEHWDVIAPYLTSTPSGHTSVDGHTEITDLDKTASNKEIVRSMITDCLMRGGKVEGLPDYVSADAFTQHTQELHDGLAPFQSVVNAPDRPFDYEEIVLLVGQGNFVATLCRVIKKEDEKAREFAQVDIFRLEDGKIVEHWDNVEPVPDNDVNSGKF
ncbi:MAG: nuclear transport factor 2 family protein [Fulvivirga sp.]|mgnify:FL=1